MKNVLSLVLTFLFVSAPVAIGQSSKDAVAVDPTHHHVILENDHVRVFEVLASPGDRSPMHTHQRLVAVSLDNARLRMTGPDGAKSILDVHPGQALWMENVEHAWELLAGQVHIIAVEIKPERGGKAATWTGRSPRDSVAVDPTNHQVIMENDHVRVLKALAVPGARSAMHTHPRLVGISLGTARSRMTSPDGRKSIFDLHPGQVFFFDGAEHAWELLAGKVHVIAVEVKGTPEASKTEGAR